MAHARTPHTGIPHNSYPLILPHDVNTYDWLCNYGQQLSTAVSTLQHKPRIIYVLCGAPVSSTGELSLGDPYA